MEAKVRANLKIEMEFGIQFVSHSNWKAVSGFPNLKAFVPKLLQCRLTQRLADIPSPQQDHSPQGRPFTPRETIHPKAEHV